MTGPARQPAGGPSHGPRLRASRRLAFALGFALACFTGQVCAGPQGGRIVAGRGGLERPNDHTLVVHQDSQSLVADWDSFNIGRGEQVRFDQPGSQAAALNRILDQNPSRILGSLSANGRVFLSNPNGLIFGKSATVNVQSLVATTLSIDDEHFMAGDYRFEYGGPGSIDNRGVLRASDGGSISLIGDSVRNEGVIIARLGRVNLASGGSATIAFDGDDLVHFEVGDGGPATALRRAENSGRIQADGGRVLMTTAAANALVTSVVNNDGMIRANSVVEHHGQVELVGDGRVINSGVLDASGRDAGTTGGEINVTGRDLLIRAGSRTDASGAGGGGAIHIGGSYRGQGPLKNAQEATLEPGSVVRADALERGNGGQVVIWSDDSTRVDGRISARGGSLGGNGGSVETSSGKVLDFTVPVDVSAPAGEAGTWLLDPEDIVIDGGKAASIESALNDGSNVSIQTASDSAGDGNITVASSIDKTEGGDASLTLDAYNRIDVNAPITSTSGKLDVALLAGSDINVNSSIDTNAGNFSATITGISGDAASGDTSTGGASSTDSTASDASSVDDSQDAPSADASSESSSATDAATSIDTSPGDVSTVPGTAATDSSGTGAASVDGTAEGSGDLSSNGQADPGSSDAAVTDGSNPESTDTTASDTASSNVSGDGASPPDAADGSAVSAVDNGGGDTAGIGITGSVTGRGADILLDAKDEATHVSGTLDASNDSGHGGTIRLLGDEVALDGATVDASGSDGGGRVLIGTDTRGQPSSDTGTRVEIDDQTSIHADGGATGDGGRVSVWAGESTTDRGNITARGGSETGDGGSVEVSSSGQVTLGGSFDVAAPRGRNGSVLIDPAELHVTTDQISPGANLTLTADELIDIASGVVVSTRDIGSGTDQVNDASVGDSGNLTLQSAQIDIHSGARLLTFADSGYASGDILLQAQAANDPSATTADGVAESSSGIRIDGALVHGGKVDITSTAQTVVNYDDATTYSGGGRYADVTSRLGARLGQSFGTKKVYGGVSVAHASSTINIEDADITADAALSVLANANASATVQTKSNALSLAYGETSANASIRVRKGSRLSAGNGVTLHATTVNATTVATNARKSQVRRPSSSSTGGALVTLAVSDTNASSSATLDSSSRIDAGEGASIQADSDRAVATFSTANAFRNGTLGQSTALSFSDIHTNARVDGRIHADSLDVKATTHALASHTGALAGFKGTASSKQSYQNVSGQLNAFFIDQTLQHALGMSLSSTLPAASSLFSSAYGSLSSAFQNQFGSSLPSGSNLTSQVINPVTGRIQNRLYRALIFEFPGSQVFTDHGNDTNAVIGSPAVVKVDHDINVKATILDEHLQNFSHSDVQLNRSGTTRPSQSALTSVAVMATIHDNSANALIEGGAVVDAGGALTIDANTDVPNDGFNWPDTSAFDNAAARLGAVNTSLTDLSSTGSQLGGIFDDFKDELRDEGDILAGLVTTSAKARAGTSSRKFPADYQIGIAGSANLLSIDNSALARIGDGAVINQDPNYRGAGQDVTVTAHSSIDTVNLSGNIGVIPPPSGTGTTGGTDSHKGDFLGVDKSSRNTTGAGSSYLGLRFGNNAIAEIGDAVALHAEALSVHGTTEMSNVSASVASGTGERYGLKGSYAGTDVQGDTEAKIDDGASVDASSVDMNASSGTPRNFNVAVGEINDRSTKTVGGTRPDDRWAAAVVDNQLQRNTQAFIGNRAGEPAGAGSVNAGTIALNAGNAGSIEGYSLAVDRTSGSGSSGSRTAQQMNYQGRRGIRGGQGTHFGIRASIDVSRNRIEDATRAYIDGGATIVAGGPLTLTSRSSSSISAFAGAATLMSDSSGTNSQRGIAGAYSENTIGDATQAFLAQVPSVTASTILLDAAATPTINGIAAGGAKSSQTDAIVGSVVNNSIDNAPDINGTRPAASPYGARAYVRDTTVQSTGNVTLTANDSPTISAIAGALAKSNAGGYGGAFALNAVGGDAETIIDNSAVNPLGILSLSATNDAGIDATAGALGKGNNDAFAGALSWNDIANTTLANVVDGKASGLSVTASAITIQATDLAAIDTFAGALGNSKNRAIGAAASVNRMADRTLAGIDNALVSAPAVTVHADTGTSGDQNTIQTRVAGLSSSGGDTIGVAVAVNDIGNQTKAYVTGGAEIRDGVAIPVDQLDIAAETYSAIDLLSVSLSNSNSSGSGNTSRVNNNPGQYLIPGSNTAFGIDISADIAFNTISDDTLAYIDQGSVVDITGPVSLTAHAASDIETTTGAIQRTTRNTGASGDVFGVAGVFSKNDLGGQTAAYIDNADVSTNGALDIAASRGGSVEAIAAGWKSGSKVGLAGAVTYNDVHTATRAGIYDSASVFSGGAARVTATDAVDLFSLAGGLMLDGEQGGVGAGVAINDFARTTSALVDDTALTGSGLTLIASTGGDVNAWAISLEKAPIGLAGSLTYNRFNDRTQAVVSNGRSSGRHVTEHGIVSLNALDNVNAFSLAGAGAIAKARGRSGAPFTAAVGVAVAYNEVGDGNLTTAAISDAVLSTDPAPASGESIALWANRDGTFEADAISGAVSGDLSIAGSGVVNNLAGTTEALIDNAVVFAGGSLSVKADSLLDVVSHAPAVSLQSKDFGFGGAATVNLLDSTTLARIVDSTGPADGATMVDALGGGAPVYTYTGELDGSGNRLTAPVNGLAVVSSASTRVENLAATLSNSRNLALGAAVSVNLVNDASSAKIGTGVEVNQSPGTPAAGQAVVVRAANHTSIDSTDGGLASAQRSAAVGAAVDVSLFNKTTSALVDHARVNAQQQVTTDARSTEALKVIAIGGALTDAPVGIAGSLSVAEFDNDTTAGVSGGLITTPGDLGVYATDSLSPDLTVGGLQGGDGLLGVAGSLVYLRTAGLTAATIGGAAQTDAGGSTDVDAHTVQDVSTTALAGKAGGDIAIAGAVAVKVLNASTLAHIGQGAHVNQDPTLANGLQDVGVASASDLYVNGLATGVEIAGEIGVGGALDVNLVNDNAAANIEDAAVDVLVGAGRDITVSAASRKDIGSVAVAGSAGGGVSVAGAVAITSISSTVNQDMADAITELNALGTGSGSPFAGPSVPGTPTVNNRTNNAVNGIPPVGTSLQAGAPSPPSGTSARVGVHARLDAGRDVRVGASLGSDNDLVAGSISLLDEASIGAGVSFLYSKDTTDALIGGALQVDAGRSVHVNALEQAVNTRSTIPGDDAHSSVAAFSGSLGSDRFGGGVVYIDEADTTRAHIEDVTAPVNAFGGSIDVTADNQGAIDATAAGVAIEGSQAAGAVVIADLENVTEAFAVRSTLRADDNLLLQANEGSDVFVVAGNIGLPSGVAVGGAVSTLISENRTSAYLDDHTDVWAGANGPAITIDNGHTDDSGATAVPVTEQVQGVAVVASSSNNLKTIVASGTLGGTVGAAAAVSADFVDDAANAYIGSTALGDVVVNGPMAGAGIGADRQVRVVAANRSDVSTFGGEGSLGNEVGVGGVISLVSYAKQTRARIENAGTVFAERQVAADAYSFDNEFSVLVAGDLNEGIGLAGSASIITAHNLTSAWINDATVLTPGGLRVHAQDDAGYNDFAGGFALTGVLGVGAGLDLYELANETRAYIDGVDGTGRQVDAGGLLDVGARSSNDIWNLALAGGLSETAGLAGGFSISNVEPVTEAYLAPGVQVDNDPGFASPGQDVWIAANDDLAVDSTAGGIGLAAEGGGAGAGIAIVVENAQLLSTVGADARVFSGGDVTVSATGRKAIQSLAIGAAASEYVAASGAVSSVVLGGGQQGDAAIFIGQLLDWLDGGVDAVATTYLVNPLRDVLGLSQTASSASARTPNLAGLSRNLKSGAGAGADSRTIAAVDTGAAVNAGGNISLVGEDRTDIVSTAGNGSAAIVGVGAGVAVASANNDVQASLGAGAYANAGGDIAIDAYFRGVSAPGESPYNVTAQAYGGSAGGLAGQASLSHAQAAPLLDAFAGPNATLVAGGAIDAQTWYDFEEQSKTVGVTIGGVTATAADSRVYASPQSRARFEAGVSAHAGGAVAVASHTAGLVVAAPVGATVTGEGLDYEYAKAVSSPLAYAYVLNGSDVLAGGNVEIASLGALTTRSEPVGGSGSVAVSITDIRSTAIGQADFRAYVSGGADRTRVQGQSVDVLAEDDASHTGLVVTARIEPAVAASVTVSSAMANASATDASAMSAYVSGNAAVTGISGAVTIGSGAPVDVESSLTSISVALGDAANNASATATTNTAFSSYVDGNLDSATTSVSGSSVDVTAGGRGVVTTMANVKPGVSVGLLEAENHLSANATGAATMNAYVVDNALVEGDGGPGTPAVSIVSGSDVVVDAKAMGGSGSLILSDVDGEINASNNSIFNAYVWGGATQTTTVQDRDSVSNDIVVATVGDIDVKAHAPVAAAVSLVGSISTLGARATDNAAKDAYVGGNALVQTLGSSGGDGQVWITSDGGISVLSKIDGGGGSLVFTGTYFTSTATDNAVYQSAVIGSVFSGGATSVKADDGVVIGSHASHPLNYGIDVESKVTSVSVSLLADDNAATVNATSNTSMLASVTGGATVDAGGGTASVSAGGDLKTYGEVRGGGGSVLLSIDRPSVTAHGNAAFTASVDGLNPIQETRVTGADVDVEATGGERGIWNEALITGGSGSGLVAVGAGSATSTEDSTLTASVLDNADLETVGALRISSTSDVNVFAKVFGGLGSGGVTVDAPGATATTNTTEQAYVDGLHHQASISGRDITIASGGVFTEPDKKSRVHTRAEINGGSGAGLVDVATASARAADKSDFEAYVVGDVSAAADYAVFVNAVATASVESEVNGGSGAGLVDVTGISVKATGKSNRTAYIAGPDTRVVVPTGGLVVRSDAGPVATDADGQLVDGLAASALINGGSGAGLVNVDTTTVNANEKSSLTAYVGGGVQVDANTVSAAAQGGVSASSAFNGGSGAGLVNVGTPSSKAVAGTAFDAHVGGSAAPVTINARDLTVDAGGSDVTVSSSFDSTDGAGIVGVSDTRSTATDKTSFSAYIGSNTTTDLTGMASVKAVIGGTRVTSTMLQRGGAGVVHVSSPTVEAKDGATLKAYIDALAGLVDIHAGNVAIEAGTGPGGLYAQTGFTGGGGDGVVAVGTTTATAKQSADIEAYVIGPAFVRADGTLSIVASSGDIVSKATASTDEGGAVSVSNIHATASNESKLYAKVTSSAGDVPSLSAGHLLIWAGASPGATSIPSHPVYVDLEAVIGTGSGGAVTVSNPVAEALDSMEVYALLGGIVATTGDIDVIASTQTKLLANPVGNTVGVLSGDQGGTATTTRDGSTIASIASDCGPYCSAISAGGHISITAEEVNELTSQVGSESGGFVATAHGMSTSTVKSTVKAEVGPTESLIAGGDVAVLAQMVPLCDASFNCEDLGVESGELIADAYTTASGGGAGSVTIATAELSPEIDAIIGEDALVRSGQSVSVKALLNSPNIYSTAHTDLDAAFTSLQVYAHSYMDSRVSTELRSGSTIIAPDGVTARAVQDQVYLLADALKEGHAIDGGTVSAVSDPKMYSKIDFQAGAGIYAYDVDFESNIGISNAYARERDNSSTITAKEDTSYDPLADVIVNGDIYMLNTEPQHLVIHPDGTIETVSGEITASRVGDTIVVDDLVNDRVGTIRLVAEAPMNDADAQLLSDGCSGANEILCSILGLNDDNLYSALKNGRIRGTTGTVHYANAYPYVLIENYSPYDLAVNKIIMSTPGTATPTITLESDNASDPSYQSWIETRQDLSSYIGSADGTYDGHIPSRYYVLSPDTDTIDNVPDPLVNPDPSIVPDADHLQITGTNGDSSIRIFSTTGADTEFHDLVNSEGRSGSIGVFNEAGNITASGSGALLRTHEFKADAYGGSIGTDSTPLPVQLVPFDDEAPTLAAFAQGSINLRTHVTDSAGGYIDGGAATIGDVTAGDEAHLTFDEAPDNYNIEGNLFGLNSLEVHVVDPSITNLNITGSLESGVENYHFTVNSDTLAPGGAWVNVDLSNVDITAPAPDLTYDVAVDRYTGAIYLYKPGFSETDQPGAAAARQYNEGDLIGFEWSQTADQVTFDSPIEHIPGEIHFTESGTGNIQITGSGSLSQLNGYSKVYIDNLSGRSLETPLIDIDQQVVSADHRSIATSTTPLTIKSDIENAYPSLQVDDFGSSEGLVDIQTSSPVPIEPYGTGGYDTLLGGDILNSSGLTHIRSEQGGIYQTDGGKVIRSRQIELRAWDYTGAGTGIIGTAAQPVRTDLQGGTLDALAYGGGIHLKEISGNLNLLRAQSSGGTGDVSLSAYDSIVDSNGGALNILGKDVTLTATLGHIDTDLSSTGVVTAAATGTGGASFRYIDLRSPGPIEFASVRADGHLSVDAQGAITDAADSLFSVGGNASFTSNGNEITLGDGASDVVNFDSLTFDGGAVSITEDSGMHLLGPSHAASANLASQTYGIFESTGYSAGSPSAGPASYPAPDGSLVVDGTASLEAAYLILLDSPDNDFGGAVSTHAGGDIVLVDKNDIELGTTLAPYRLFVHALNGSITDSGAASIGGTAHLSATGDIVLDTLANDFQDAVYSDGANTTLVDANDILLGTNVAHGDFSVTARNGSITQTPGDDGVSVDGDTSLQATGVILMDNPLNDFRGSVDAVNSSLPAVQVVGPRIELVDRNSIDLHRVISGSDLFVTAHGAITDSAGSVIDVPFSAHFNAAGDITLGDDAADLVNFGHFGVDALGGDQYGLEVNGKATAITEHSATNFFGNSHVASLDMNTFGDMTDSGEVTVDGISKLQVTRGNSIYLDTKNSAYFGDVTFDTVSGSGRIHNIRFIDGSDLLLHPLTVTGFLDIAALSELRTSDLGPVRSLGGAISLNGYNELFVGRGGVIGAGAVNLAAADGHFGQRSYIHGPSNLHLGGDVISTGGKVSLLAGDNIFARGGTVRTPVNASFMATRGKIGSASAPVPIDVGGIVTLFQTLSAPTVTGSYGALTVHQPLPNARQFFQDVFFRGLPTIPPPPTTPPSSSTTEVPPCQSDPAACETQIKHFCSDSGGFCNVEHIPSCVDNPDLCERIIIDMCTKDPSACKIVSITPKCIQDPSSCVPVTIPQCLSKPGGCALTPCAGDPQSCSLVPYLQHITGEPFEPVEGNAVAKNNTSNDEIRICNGVNLFGENKECKPVNQDVEIFEIKQPLYSIGP